MKKTLALIALCSATLLVRAAAPIHVTINNKIHTSSVVVRCLDEQEDPKTGSMKQRETFDITFNGEQGKLKFTHDVHRELKCQVAKTGTKELLDLKGVQVRYVKDINDIEVSISDAKGYPAGTYYLNKLSTGTAHTAPNVPSVSLIKSSHGLSINFNEIAK